jgi:hypothetical protein
MFSIKSWSIVAVSLSALVLSTCSSNQKPSTTPANTKPPSAAQTVEADWSIYMEAPDYHFTRARKYLENGDYSKAAAELKRGNSFLVFQKSRLSAASKQIEALSDGLSTGKNGNVARLDSITFDALNVLKNKFAMVPLEIVALSAFEEAYKYHYDQAKLKLHKKELADAAYEIRSAGSFLKLIKVSWPDTATAELYMAGNELQELAPKVETGAVKDTTALEKINQKIIPIVSKSKK